MNFLPLIVSLLNSKAKGELTEILFLAKLVKCGYAVSVPFGNNQRYDLVVDHKGKLYKCQCKTARFKNGCVQFSPHSTNGFKHSRRGYLGEIDCFLVYCPQLDTYYNIPVGLFSGRGTATLRVNPPKNGANLSSIKWAKDYEFDISPL